MKKLNLPLAVLTTVLISACGGGSSGDDPTAAIDTTDLTPGAANPTATTPVEEPILGGELQTGRFVDSAVVGLQYTTETQAGVTDSDGTFNYLAGENVTFSIGDITLPTTPGADIITPLSVFSTTNITDTSVMNLSRLLQTLDTDGDPANGITLSDAANASTAGLTVDFASPTFDDQVVNLVNNSGSTNTSLVEGIDALEHLQETLFIEGIEERPTGPVAEEEPTILVETGNPSTNLAVGRSSEFSNFAHDISGTLTVIDDRTLEITDFNYDGGGVVVFFYNGIDGDYTNGQPFGSQLNGRPFVDETITLTIPDNLTLDDFNGISVWCVPFSANFGDAQF